MSLFALAVVLAIVAVVAVVASGKAPVLGAILEAVFFLLAIIWLLRQLLGLG